QLRRLGLIALVVMVLLASLVLRYGGAAGVDLALIAERSGSYAIGPVYAFSAWVSTGGLAVSEAGFGRYSIAGIFELLGIGRRVSGFYEYIVINDATAESNIFSAFRGLIQDFYLPGALFLLFLLGILAQLLISRRASSATSYAASIGLLSAIYLFVGWSPIISIFNYNGVHFAVFTVLFTLLICVRRVVSGARTEPGRQVVQFSERTGRHGS